MTQSMISLIPNKKGGGGHFQLLLAFYKEIKNRNEIAGKTSELDEADITSPLHQADQAKQMTMKAYPAIKMSSRAIASVLYRFIAK